MPHRHSCPHPGPLFGVPWLTARPAAFGMGRGVHKQRFLPNPPCSSQGGNIHLIPLVGTGPQLPFLCRRASLHWGRSLREIPIPILSPPWVASDPLNLGTRRPVLPRQGCSSDLVQASSLGSRSFLPHGLPLIPREQAAPGTPLLTSPVDIWGWELDMGPCGAGSCIDVPALHPARAHSPTQMLQDPSGAPHNHPVRIKD